jgi:hypothetical protein
VFNCLYKAACYRACRDGLLRKQSSTLVLPSGFARKVEDEFSRLAHELSSRSTHTAAGLHRRLLARLHGGWAKVRSDDTCLVCLRRRPQHRLPCGHCLCDNCPRIFGQRSRHDPWLFTVRSCFLCGLATPGVEVRYLPENAGVRVLTLDGGGVRGLATLQYGQYLKALEERIGLPYPVQENFDLAYGTSSGELGRPRGTPC